jgi:hypothetical protein
MGLFSRRSKDPDRAQHDAPLSEQLADPVSGDAVDMGSLMGGVSDALEPGVAEQMDAYRERIVRLRTVGVERPATILAVSLEPVSPLLGGVPTSLSLTVDGPAKVPYDVHVEQVTHEAVAATLQTGQRVLVRVDPGDPTCAMLANGVVGAGPGPDPGD